MCSDCDEKKSIKNEKVLELQQEIDTIQSDLDATMQQQKIIDKKINNVTKLQESLKDELDNFRMQRDDLSLEIVDLNEGELIYSLKSYLQISYSCVSCLRLYSCLSAA